MTRRPTSASASESMTVSASMVTTTSPVDAATPALRVAAMFQVFVHDDHGAGGLRDGLRRVRASVGDDDDLRARTGPARPAPSECLESAWQQRLFVVSGHDDREPRTRGHGEASAALWVHLRFPLQKDASPPPVTTADSPRRVAADAAFRHTARSTRPLADRIAPPQRPIPRQVLTIGKMAQQLELMGSGTRRPRSVTGSPAPC